VDVRASDLQQEYIKKARKADRKYNGTAEGEVGRVESKLVELGEVQGLVCGNFGEVSEPTHALIDAMATSRVRIARPTRGKRGVMRSEDAERSVAVSSIRRKLGVATVKAQAFSLLGRLETMGPGTAAAAGRRRQAGELERQWLREEQANALASRQGWRAFRTGFAKTD
jgi:hypothetical protein